MMELETLLSSALELGVEGEWEEAAELLRSGLEDFPEEPAVLCWLGAAERELGMDGIAYERFKQCLALQPEDPHILATAGTALATFDDPEAEAALRTAAILAPELPLARWMYGAYLAREGFVTEALAELDAAVVLAPDDGVVALERGVAMALAGDLQGAVFDLTRAAEADEEDGWPLVLLGLIEVEAGEWEEAADRLEAGARLRPEDVEAQALAALAAAAVEREEVALEMLERGRQRAQGADLQMLNEADDRVVEGVAPARELLVNVVGPSSLRERLMTRP
jgi:tetratricopeptide (TPR) repeat protein